MMDKNWIALTEYSNKYKISISTLRRRIRTGLIAFRQKSGKYFLKDENPENQKNTLSSSAVLPSEFLKEDNLKETGVSYQKKLEMPSLKKQSISGGLFSQQDEALINKLLDTQKLLQEQLSQKDRQIETQKNQLNDLNTLVALLEKENKQLKSLVYQEKELEDWLSG